MSHENEDGLTTLKQERLSEGNLNTLQDSPSDSERSIDEINRIDDERQSYFRLHSFHYAPPGSLSLSTSIEHSQDHASLLPDKEKACLSRFKVYSCSATGIERRMSYGYSQHPLSDKYPMLSDASLNNVIPSYEGQQSQPNSGNVPLNAVGNGDRDSRSRPRERAHSPITAEDEPVGGSPDRSLQFKRAHFSHRGRAVVSRSARLRPRPNETGYQRRRIVEPEEQTGHQAGAFSDDSGVEDI